MAKKWIIVAALAAMLAGCNNDVEPRMQQEQNGEVLDEREDETLNGPMQEYRTEQREDGLEERNDD